MATTWIKRTLTVHIPDAAALETLPLYLLEASSQTFLAGSPLVFSSGYIAVASDPVESMHAIAMEDAHNITAGTQRVKVVPVSIGANVHLFGNLLTTAAADNVLAATDEGTKMQINYEATGGAGSVPIWHFGDSTSNPGVKVVAFQADPGFLPPNSEVVRPIAGDTNARVLAVVLDSAADWAA